MSSEDSGDGEYLPKVIIVPANLSISAPHLPPIGTDTKSILRAHFKRLKLSIVESVKCVIFVLKLRSLYVKLAIKSLAERVGFDQLRYLIVLQD
jgi:hypothetical protein